MSKSEERRLEAQFKDMSDQALQTILERTTKPALKVFIKRVLQSRKDADNLISG